MAASSSSKKACLNRVKLATRVAPAFYLDDYSHTVLGIAGCANCAGCSGRLLPPSPPAEQATTRQDKAGKSGTCDGAGGWWPPRGVLLPSNKALQLLRLWDCSQ